MAQPDGLATAAQHHRARTGGAATRAGRAAQPTAPLVAMLAVICLPLMAHSARSTVHGLRFRHVDDRGHYLYAPAVDSCRNPSHDAVLRNYSQSTFVEDPEVAADFWGVDNVAESEMLRYIIVRKLNDGAEGSAFEAIDSHTGKLVAIKKVSNLFDHESLMVPKQVLAEVRSLAITKYSKDFMTLNRMLLPRNPHEFNTVYIVLDMLEAKMPRAGDPTAGDIIEPEAAETLRLRVFQLVRGMAFLHTAGLVHGDLRFHNIMLDDKCNVRIIDLGDLEPGRPDPNVTVRDHFPGTGHHSLFSRDLWMMGTTILTWVGGKQMYLDKTKPADVKARMIVNVLGLQAPEVLAMYSYDIQSSFLKAEDWFMRSGHTPATLEERLPTIDPRLFTMVRRVMRLDHKASSAMELLEDPYFEGLHGRYPVTEGPKDSLQELSDIWTKCTSVRNARRMIHREIIKNK